MNIAVVLIHIIIDLILGLSILPLLKISKVDLANLFIGLGLGIFFETAFIALLSFIGFSILQSIIAVAILAIVNSFFQFRKIEFSLKLSLSNPRLNILEWIVIGVILEKLLWSLFILVKMPIYFDDALNHWSGRGKALFYEVNWSWSPDSVYFLGKAFGHMEYPLLSPIWRAVNHALLGSPSNLTERIDGLIFWVISIVVLFTWIKNLTGTRWVALVGSCIFTMLPLETWHISAGYSEIIIQTYFLLTLWSISDDRYILGGIFTAAMIWSKNEGLIIFCPAATVYLIIHLLTKNELKNKQKIHRLLTYAAAWLIAIMPWLIFKWVNSVGFTVPSKQGIEYVDGSLGLFISSLFTAPSSTIFWIIAGLVIIIFLKRISHSKELIALSVTGIFLICALAFVFTCTGAYIFMENQTTIHRSLLQITPVFVILLASSPFISKVT